MREEVDILQHLSRASPPAMRGGIRRHPNILAYVDSWEQDEALFIQTELCELGNFAHFLWEYGRAFPKLEEARVWKILADLSNVSLPLGSCRCLVVFFCPSSLSDLSPRAPIFRVYALFTTQASSTST